MGRVVVDTSITGVLTGPAADFPLLPGIQHVSDGLLDQLPIGIAIFDREGRLVRYNRRAAELCGRKPELGSLAEVMHIRAPLRDKEIVFDRPDGSRIFVSANADPLFSETGEMIGAVVCMTDITALKREHEQRAQASRQLLDTLMSVLNHRVKNTLATVQALASQTIRGRGVKRDVRAKFVERLFALSRAHDLLTREGWESADLLSVVQEVLAPHHGRIEVQGATARVSPKITVALSMVLQELASNAVRYGALSVRGGKVTVAVTIEATKGGSRMTLNWRESGGPPVLEPAQRGFGLKLVERSIAQELSGAADIAFEAGGVHCTLSFPIAGEDNSAQVQQPAPSPPAQNHISTAA